ncbi:YraN family protein [Microseira sp. BLCC-F43]|uniref:YraN family protein n=1 Tax=Microseira sp. BLCC-F43 TaxID=3153602 RepID=UPI0035BA6F92
MVDPSHPPSSAADIGILGEDFVASWLQAQGWTILHRRWRCRWGELDIIAQQGAGEQRSRGAGEQGSKRAGENVRSNSPLPLCPPPPLPSSSMPYIAFVEVKTRSQRNWDGDGREAIAPQKQAKLWSAATAFLAAYPEKAEYPCRFDVACVGYQRLSRKLSQAAIANDIISDRSLQIPGYRLFLRDYIQSAFDN